MANGSLMKVESIAECSLGAFCNTFDLHYAIIGLDSIQVHLKSYFTTQYFKSFFTLLLYIIVHVLPYMQLNSHVIRVLKILSTYNETAFEYKFQMHSN